MRELNFYLTQESDCSYLPDLQQRSIVADPKVALNTATYSVLAGNGFRRSGNMAYRPNCINCQACIPLRIPVDKFTPSRSQRRNIKKNSDIIVSAHPAKINDEHFALYCKYLAHRHQGSSMNNPSKEDYEHFLICADVDTYFYEFRLKGKLIAVAVTDILDHGLSAVYTFFDPDLNTRGLGSYAILWQCQHAKTLNLPWLYLGFWIEDSPQMAYKVDFQPAEGIQNRQWLPIPPRVRKH